MTNWIKCSERLPDVGFSVIAFGKLGDEPKSDSHEAFMNRDRTWKSVRASYDRSLNLRIHNVTHWQPLPQAPNED